MLCTFTNKAAREMLSRVEGLSGGTARVLGGTFHHIANVMLRTNASLIGYRDNFGILDDSDAADLLGSLLPEAGMNATDGTPAPRPELVHTVLGLASNMCMPVGDVILELFPHLYRSVSDFERLSDLFEVRKKDLNVMDFDGLLVNVKRLLEQSGEVRDRLSRQYQHILVDEYQDTTKLQSDIVELLAGYNSDLMMVGDDAQAIYSFRGARLGNMLDFPVRHPGCRVITLTKNYRSSPQILGLANRILAGNRAQFKKDLETDRPPGQLPAFVPLRDGDEQAAFVAQRISELSEEGTGLSDIAVLYRAHSHSLDLQVALARRGIPFIVRSGVRFFEQAHIKDILSMLRFLWNPADEISLMRLLKMFPGIGNATAAGIATNVRRRAAEMPDAAAAKSFKPEAVRGRAEKGWSAFQSILSLMLVTRSSASPDMLIDIFVRNHYGTAIQTRYADSKARIEDIEQLQAFASRYSSLDEFLKEIGLLSNLEIDRSKTAEGGRQEMVTLSSVHQSKGLEWRVVFAIWLCDGRFPSSLALKDMAGEEEERRLFYVAVTRAKDDLYLCQPMSETGKDRQLRILRPSRFITEIGAFEALTERWAVSKTLEDPERRQ
jgi:DNA helicase-2/ATP-dependent DNA helicase PcrA